MSDAASAWKDTGERFAALGSSLKAHFDAERAAGAAPADDLGEAARRFGAAIQDAVEALGSAANDPAVKDEVRRVGSSLVEALGATFAEVSRDLKGMAERQGGTWSSADRPNAEDHVGSDDEPPAGSPTDHSEPGPEEPPGVEPWGTP